MKRLIVEGGVSSEDVNSIELTDEQYGSLLQEISKAGMRQGGGLPDDFPKEDYLAFALLKKFAEDSDVVAYTRYGKRTPQWKVEIRKSTNKVTGKDNTLMSAVVEAIYQTLMELI